MITKANYFYLKAQSAKLQARIWDYQNGPVYQTYQKWVALSPEQKDALKAKWIEYYTACARSEAADRFRKARIAYRQSDISQVNELVDVAKKNRASGNIAGPVKPSSVDPEELVLQMYRFFNAESTLKEMDATIEEYRPAYEPSTNSRHEL